MRIGGGRAFEKNTALLYHPVCYHGMKTTTMPTAVIIRKICGMHRMPFHFMWLPLLAVQFSSFGQEAILKTVPVRLRMEPAAQASWPADVGVVEMTPGLRLPEPFSVYSADGKAVSFQTL